MKKSRKIIMAIAAAAVVLAILLILFFKRIIPGNGGTDHSGCNIVLITADALRLDMLGCYGGPAHTPNIDELAANGLLFEKAYSTAPCTIPSSVSMLSGNYSSTYVVVNRAKQKPSHPISRYAFYISDRETLLAEALRKKGYDCLMDVESPVVPLANTTQGFTIFKKKKKMTPQEIAYVGNTLEIKDTDRTHYLNYTLRNDLSFALLHYLLTVPPERKFFLLKWFFDPHDPYNPAKMFKDRIPPVPGKLSMKEEFYTHNRPKAFWKLLQANKLTPYDYFYIRALYKAEVESIDWRVGHIVKALKLRGLLNKTLIVFTADHGELLGEHDWFGHEFQFFEPLVHVPLIFSGPGVPKGKRNKTPVSHLDLMPTLKEWAGVRFEENMQGESYCALLHDGSTLDRILYFDRVTNHPNAILNCDAVLMKDLKLIADERNGRVVLELFNVHDDPGENKDILPNNPQARKDMFKKIFDTRKENNLRLKDNLAKIGKEVKPERIWEKTLEQLKSLGYIH